MGAKKKARTKDKKRKAKATSSTPSSSSASCRSSVSTEENTKAKSLSKNANAAIKLGKKTSHGGVAQGTRKLKKRQRSISSTSSSSGSRSSADKSKSLSGTKLGKRVSKKSISKNKIHTKETVVKVKKNNRGKKAAKQSSGLSVENECGNPERAAKSVHWPGAPVAVWPHPWPEPPPGIVSGPRHNEERCKRDSLQPKLDSDSEALFGSVKAGAEKLVKKSQMKLSSVTTGGTGYGYGATRILAAALASGETLSHRSRASGESAGAVSGFIGAGARAEMQLAWDRSVMLLEDRAAQAERCLQLALARLSVERTETELVRAKHKAAAAAARRIKQGCEQRLERRDQRIHDLESAVQARAAQIGVLTAARESLISSTAKLKRRVMLQRKRLESLGVVDGSNEQPDGEATFVEDEGAALAAAALAGELPHRTAAPSRGALRVSTHMRHPPIGDATQGSAVPSVLLADAFGATAQPVLHSADSEADESSNVRPGVAASRQLSFAVGSEFLYEVRIVSYRTGGDKLWYVKPGTRVACDSCGQRVAQDQGWLLSDPSRSQFSQERFSCLACCAHDEGPQGLVCGTLCDSSTSPAAVVTRAEGSEMSTLALFRPPKVVWEAEAPVPADALEQGVASISVRATEGRNTAPVAESGKQRGIEPGASSQGLELRAPLVMAYSAEELVGVEKKVAYKASEQPERSEFEALGINDVAPSSAVVRVGFDCDERAEAGEAVCILETCQTAGRCTVSKLDAYSVNICAKSEKNSLIECSVPEEIAGTGQPASVREILNCDGSRCIENPIHGGCIPTEGTQAISVFSPRASVGGSADECFKEAIQSR